jgi:hypothetical protein
VFFDHFTGACLSKEKAMKKRRRFKPTMPLRDRLASFANSAREKAAQLAPGPEQKELLLKARRADTASHLDDWANSQGLPPPK